MASVSRRPRPTAPPPPDRRRSSSTATAACWRATLARRRARGPRRRSWSAPGRRDTPTRRPDLDSPGALRYTAGMHLSIRVHGRSHRFGTVREVLARANEPKAGDERAGIGARSHLERAAAKLVLAELTLADLREHPVRSEE